MLGLYGLSFRMCWWLLTCGDAEDEQQRREDGHDDQKELRRNARRALIASVLWRGRRCRGRGHLLLRRGLDAHCCSARSILHALYAHRRISPCGSEIAQLKNRHYWENIFQYSQYSFLCMKTGVQQLRTRCVTTQTNVKPECRSCLISDSRSS